MNKGKKAIGVLLILVLGLIGFYLLRNSNQKNLKSSQTEIETETVKAGEELEENRKEIREDIPEDPAALKPEKNHNWAADAYTYDTKKVREELEGISHYPDEKIAFLTFDDGPNHKITPKVLDTLKEEKVPGTFFVIGSYIDENNKPVLERIVKEGHGIGTHSFTHDYTLLYPNKKADPKQILKENEDSVNALKKVLGSDFDTKVNRYPGGHFWWEGVDQSDILLYEDGVEWIDWNSQVGDSLRRGDRPTSPEGQVEYLKKTLMKSENTNIAVILLHDSADKQLTADSLSSVIKYLKDQGYRFGILN